jgi:predicted amidophosphoribosyltransferase
MFDRLMSIIAPHECLLCNQEGSLLCMDCLGGVQAQPERCYRCRALSPGGRTCAKCRRSSSLHSVQAAAPYSGVIKDLVWRLKFGHARAAALPMAKLIVQRCAFDDNVILVFVPTATSRRRRQCDPCLRANRHKPPSTAWIRPI